MKLNCDRLGDWINERRKRREQWHDWFAWHPVRLKHGDCRWLEVVERRVIVQCWDRYVWTKRDYRPKNG